jgi:trehalose-phosphatase
MARSGQQITIDEPHVVSNPEKRATRLRQPVAISARRMARPGRRMAVQVLSPRFDLTQFIASLPSVRERVLMLDYDGTLAPFQVRPDRAVPYPGVTDVLRELMNEGMTRVVIISGRRAAELVPLLALEQHPEIWGGHGWERLLPDGTLLSHAADPALHAALDDASNAVGELLRIGARLERKPASLALHWRGLSALAVAKIEARARELWTSRADGEFDLLAFDGGLELRASSCNKQHAVKAVLSETGNDSAVAYLGDDLTDEDAFQAVKPRGIAVLVRPEIRETAADLWIRPPRELLSFIRNWLVGSVKG